MDTSKSFSPETLAAFEQADDVYLVATVDLPSLRNIQRALPLLKRVMPRGGEQMHLVINRYDPANEISLKDVERSLGDAGLRHAGRTTTSRSSGPSTRASRWC